MSYYSSGDEEYKKIYRSDRRAARRDLGHDCPAAGRYGYGEHRACPVCDDCDYGQSIDTTTGTCGSCWAKIAAARKAKYPDYCEKKHSCSNCKNRFCVKEREVGVCYVPGLTKEAKSHLQKDYKNFCAYCLHGLLMDPKRKRVHTGVKRALDAYQVLNPQFNPDVAPVPYVV